MCISTDYPHFDSNFPNVASNLLSNVTRETAAQILMGGAHLYGMGEEHFAKAALAAEVRQRRQRTESGASRNARFRSVAPLGKYQNPWSQAARPSSV